MNRKQRLLNLFKFSRRSRNVLLIALILPALLMVCLLAALAAGSTDPSPSSSTLSDAEALFLSAGFILLPLSAVFSGFAALREPRHPPRALLWTISTILLLLAGIVIAIEMLRDPALEKPVAAMFMLAFVGPLALLLSMPGVYSIVRAVPEIRAVLQEETSQRILHYILACGAVRFSELASATGIPLSEVDNRVDELLYSGKLAGSMNTEQQWIYTSGYLAEKQRQLLEWVNLRGRIRMDELARQLQTSAEMTIEWLYQLVQRGQFDGYINWPQQLIYASTAHQIGSESQCPQCGGQLSPASGQRILCLHCGTEHWQTKKFQSGSTTSD